MQRIATPLYEQNWGPAIPQGYPAGVLAPWQQQGVPRPAPAFQAFSAPPGVQLWNGVSSLNAGYTNVGSTPWLTQQMYAAPQGIQRNGISPYNTLTAQQIQSLKRNVAVAQLSASGPASVQWAQSLSQKRLTNYGSG